MQLEFIIATITLLTCPFVVLHTTRILKDSNSPAGTTRELHLQQYSWHSSSDTAKIKSPLREYLAAQAHTGNTQQVWWHHRYFFLVLKHSRIIWESYFIKCDVLQSVVLWYICFGCGNIPFNSLCTYTLINLLPVENFHLPCNYLGIKKKIQICHLVGQPLTDWVKGRLRSQSFGTVWSEVYRCQWVHGLICATDLTFYLIWF